MRSILTAPTATGYATILSANALHWMTEYHIDGLRLDAVHGIYDFSARHILLELAEAVHQEGIALGRQLYVIAESDLNDVRLINPPEAGGYGLAAQWNDDFHHALRTLLTGEKSGYYADFGTFADLVKSLPGGFRSLRRIFNLPETAPWQLLGSNPPRTAGGVLPES